MQAEIDTTQTSRPVHILGLNAIGHESANALACEGRALPWLQDVPAQNAWQAWHATWRDVFVVGPENEVLHVYNLTEHNLARPSNYATLRSLLLQAAQ
jgi:hypothetical protein